MAECNYLSNSQLDRKKWDHCVSNSFNNRVYGLSWYLDLVSENWDAIIYGDYKAVFPIAFKDRIFFKKYYHPLFAQQLGPFISSEFNDNDIKKIVACFFDFMSNKNIFFNFCSTSEFRYYFDEVIFKNNTYPFSKFHNVIERVNLEINLNSTYPSILKNYNTNTIRNIEKSNKRDLYVHNDIDTKDFISLYIKNVAKKINLKRREVKTISRILDYCKQKEKGVIMGVLYEEKIIAAAFFLSCFNRDVLIFHATDSSFKQFHPITYLINHYIFNNSNSNKILDFEGSNISGVYRFYKGFGAKENNYYMHQ